METEHMTSSGPGIVFMGTPEFAVESLKRILEAGYLVRGVVTAPDKPSGRGLKLHPPPVKEFALEHNLPVLQPLKLKDPGFLSELKGMHADLQVVVAFRMLPEEVWNMPPLGTFNLHASLLPDYRGAAPINWVIMNGETRTGVTTFFLNHEIDKGSVIFTEETGIGAQETAGMLHDRLMVTGAGLVVKTIDAIATGKVTTTDQHFMASNNLLHQAPKIFRNDCRIRWELDNHTLYNFIRGLSPFPAAWCELVDSRGKVLHVRIYFAETEQGLPGGQPGSCETDGKSYLRVATGNGYIRIRSIHLEGKRQMEVSEFLRGYPQISQCRFQ
jgi:methionyl-tRNA formyltransferase